MENCEIVINNIESFKSANKELQIQIGDLLARDYDIKEVIISIPKVTEFQVVIRASRCL